MSKNEHSLPTFRPYKEDDLTPLTLREVLRDEYLYGAIMWLLGYDASLPLQDQINNRPMRAQEIGSAWQVAWTVRDCLHARQIFAQDEVHTELVEEIDRKLLGDDSLQGAATWLLEQGHANDGGLASWAGRLFDTATVVNTLIRLRAQYPVQLSTGKLCQTAKGGLGWLFEHLSGLETTDRQASLWQSHVDLHTLAPDWDNNGALAQMIQALVNAARLDRELFNMVRRQYAREQSSDADPVLFLSKLLLSRGRPPEVSGESDTPELRCWADHIGVLGALVRVYEHLGPDHPEIEEVLSNLRGGLIYLERQSIFPDHHGPRSNALATYIEGCQVLGRGMANVSQWDDFLVLSTLHKQCHPTSHFKDGSIYLDLYATKYFADCLAQAIESWPRSRESIVQIYDDALKAITKEGRMTAERVQIHEMNRTEYELRNQLKDHQQTLIKKIDSMRKRLNLSHAALAAALGLIVVAGFSIFLWNPNDAVGSIGAITGILAMVIALITWIIDRIWSKRDGS